jgi:hypothetical protein
LHGYLESKQFLFSAVKEALRLSFGVREEHRISLAFFDQMKESLEASGDWDQVRHLIDDDYEHIWELPSREWLDYIYMNANKYTAAFEWIRSLDESKSVAYEHCKVMTMFLHALPFTFDTGPFKHQAEIWQERF